MAATSVAHADCGPIGAYAATSTDFDGTIQTQSACGAFQAIPNLSFVTDPDNGGSALSRAEAAGGVGVPLSLGVFAQSSRVALSASSTATFSDTFALDVGQTAALQDYAKLRASQDDATLIFGPAGSTQPLANLSPNATYDLDIDIDVGGSGGQFTGATFDLTFGDVTEVVEFNAGVWSVSQGEVIVAQVGGEESLYFTFSNVAPPTPEDPADFDLGVTATAGSDGETQGKIDLLDPVTFGGVTVEDYLGNIVPSVSIVSGSGAFYAVTDGVAAGSVPEPSTFAFVGAGLAGLGFLRWRAATSTTAARRRSANIAHG